MLRGSVEVGEKQNSISFEGQTEFGMPRDAKMSLAHCSLFQFKYYLRACTTSRKKLLILYAKQPIKNDMGPTPKENPIELKNNSSYRLKYILVH